MRSYYVIMAAILLINLPALSRMKKRSGRILYFALFILLIALNCAALHAYRPISPMMWLAEALKNYMNLTYPY